MPECSGNNLLTVSIDGKAIKGMPVTVAVIPSYASLRLEHKITGVINAPRGIATADNGEIFVVGWTDGDVYQFDKNGKKLSNWRVPGSNAHKVVVHGESIYVAQCFPHKLLKYTLNQTLVETAFVDGCYYDLEVGPDGRLYAIEWYTQQMRIFNLNDDSLFLEFTGTPSPIGLAFDPHGNVHVTEYNPPVIRVFSPSGVLMRNYTQPSASVGYHSIMVLVWSKQEFHPTEDKYLRSLTRYAKNQFFW